MMKKTLILLSIIGIMIFSLTGCKNNNEDEPITKTDAVKFKEEYEKLNGVDNGYGGEHRTITIPENNPMVYSNAKEIVEKIENGEKFYVYFGSSYCPWCRSVIEKAIELADFNNIDKIYYVDIWDGNHVEILRDKYKLNDKGKPELVSEGAPEYAKLLEYFDDVLDDYTLKNKDGKEIKVGEKRIIAPNIIYVENGKGIRLGHGMSEKQEKANDELTEEILKDQEIMFDELFVNEDVCNEDGC